MDKKLSLSDYLKDGVAVLDKGVYYYIKADGNREPLGTVPVVAYNKIRSLLKVNNGQESSQLSNLDNQAETQTQSGISDLVETIPQKQIKQENNDDDELALLVHRRRQIPVGADLDVMIGGLKQTERENPSVPASHPVKRIPYVFHWQLVKHKVVNGNSATAKGVQVVTRRILELLQRKYDVVINRDDTQDLDHIQVGELLLCIEDRKDFDYRKKKQSFEGSLAPQKSLNQRKETTKKMAAISDLNPESMETVKAMLTADERENIKVNAEKKQVSEGLARPLEEVMTELSSNNLSMEEMNNIQSEMAQNTFKARPL